MKTLKQRGKLVTVLRKLAPLCIPFRLGVAKESDWSWLGGNPPKECSIRLDPSKFGFLMALDISEEGRQLCVFVNRNFDVILDSANRFRSTSNARSAVKVTLAPRSLQAASSSHQSQLSRVSIELTTPVRDWPADVSNMTWNHHKLGGFPYVWVHKKIGPEIRKANKKGFVHLLQLSFPNHEDADCEGNWPFGPYTLFLFSTKMYSSFGYILAR